MPPSLKGLTSTILEVYINSLSCFTFRSNDKELSFVFKLAALITIILHEVYGHLQRRLNSYSNDNVHDTTQELILGNKKKGKEGGEQITYLIYGKKKMNTLLLSQALVIIDFYNYVNDIQIIEKLYEDPDLELIKENFETILEDDEVEKIIEFLEKEKKNFDKNTEICQSFAINNGNTDSSDIQTVCYLGTICLGVF